MLSKGILKQKSSSPKNRRGSQMKTEGGDGTAGSAGEEGISDEYDHLPTAQREAMLQAKKVIKLKKRYDEEMGALAATEADEIFGEEKID